MNAIVSASLMEVNSDARIPFLSALLKNSCMDTIDEIHRQRLALLIKEAGSQKKLADLSGKAPAQVSQWLNASPDSKTGMRSCYSGKDIGADFFPDVRTGRAAMSVKTGLSITAMLVVDIAAADDNTKVTIHHFRGAPKFADAVEKWITGDYSACPYS